MPPSLCSSRRNERGSALLYIFIGIIIFAALTFAISNSSRQSMSKADKEQSELFATQLIDYVGMIRRAVQMMKIDAVKDSELCFHNAGWGHNNYNHAACAEAKNQIFNTAGGGASFQKPAPDLLDSMLEAEPLYGQWYFTGANSVTGVGTDCVPNADCNELLVVLPYIKQSVCIALNKKLQNTTNDTIPVNGTNFNITEEFAGAYVNGATVTSALLNGKRSGCFQADTSPVTGSFVFFAVLIAR